MDLDEMYGAHNYHPVDVTISYGEGSWVTDIDGKRYLDLISAYSALNFGHRHPQLLAAAQEQLSKLTLTSRAVKNDQLGSYVRDLAQLCGMEAVLPMNTGAEAVETGIKIARKWGYTVKGISGGAAEIIVMDGNFHGRTTTIVGFSSDPDARTGFEPSTPGFISVPFGDIVGLREAITPNTAAVLIEPIQGEGGVKIPPEGYLRSVRETCDEHNVLFIADEIQSGLGRAGATFACDRENVVPDMYLLGKALGGGLYPVSAVVTSRAVMDVIGPNQHGSTFGGNPLGARIAREVVLMLSTGQWQKRALELENLLEEQLAAVQEESSLIREVRVRGAWAAVEMRGGPVDLPERDVSYRHTAALNDAPPAREICERVLQEGLLMKDTQRTTIRLAPPLTITDEEMIGAIEVLRRVVTR